MRNIGCSFDANISTCSLVATPTAAQICDAAPDIVVNTVNQLITALQTVTPGQVILVSDGIYILPQYELVSSVDDVTICGQTQSGTIIKTPDEGTGPKAMLRVYSNNLRVLRLTIKHQ